MNCETVRELLLTDYLDNELDPAARAEIEAHLTSCNRCRHDHDIIRKVLHVPAESLAPVLPRRDLWPRIEKKIQEEIARKSGGRADRPETVGTSKTDEPTSPATPSGSRKRSYLLRLLIIALLAFSWSLCQRQSRTSSVSPPVVQPAATSEWLYDTEFTSIELRSIEWLLVSEEATTFEERLKLEAIQKEHLTNFRQAFLSARSARRSRLASAHRDLQTLRASTSADKEELAKKQKHIETLTVSSFEARRQEVERIRDLLTPDQRATLLDHFKTLGR